MKQHFTVTSFAYAEILSIVFTWQEKLLFKSYIHKSTHTQSFLHWRDEKFTEHPPKLPFSKDMKPSPYKTFSALCTKHLTKKKKNPWLSHHSGKKASPDNISSVIILATVNKPRLSESLKESRPKHTPVFPRAERSKTPSSSPQRETPPRNPQTKSDELSIM